MNEDDEYQAAIDAMAEDGIMWPDEQQIHDFIRAMRKTQGVVDPEDDLDDLPVAVSPDDDDLFAATDAKAFRK